MLPLPALAPFGSRTLDVQSLVRCFWAVVWVSQAFCGKKQRAGSQEALHRYRHSGLTLVYATWGHTNGCACIDSFLPCAANSVHRLESNLLEQARQRDAALRSLILEHNLSVLRRIDQLEGELADAQRPVMAARLHTSVVHPKGDAFAASLDAPGTQLEALPELQAATPEQAGGPAPSSTALRALDIDEAQNATIIPVSKAGRKRKAESCASPHGRKRHGSLAESAA